jgi:hypothetical protein
VANIETRSVDTITARPHSTGTSGVRFAALTGFVFAVLQSICTAYLALSGIRVAIGLTALAAAGGTYELPTGLHQDAIRIPMMILGGLGAIANLAILIRVWRLRARASGNWRRRTIPARERRSERWQLAISLITLALLGAELVTHSMVHKTRPERMQLHSQAK